ncbi:MAG: hypothetical protein U1E39_10305 [Planctomycetota bacterium]
MLGRFSYPIAKPEYELIKDECVVRSTVPTAREFLVSSSIDPRVAALLESDAVPALKSSQLHDGLHVGFKGSLPLMPVIRPMIRTASGYLLAGEFTRPTGALCWSLPSGIDLAKWAQLATECWSELAPDRFPSNEDDWHADRRWQTAAEARAALALAARVAINDVARAALTAAEDALRADCAAATRAATCGARRLLTAQGDELKLAVGEALSSFGFRVIDYDTVAPQGDRLEDLRITDPTSAGWEAIAEVRGYVQGAKLNDLLRIPRFASRYAVAQKREPSACWYVVNQFLDRDPASRDRALSSNPGEVETFATDYRGVLIDTVDLFRLLASVEAGDTPASEARRLLSEARGRFNFPVVGA